MLSLLFFFFASHFSSVFQFLLSYFVHPITYVQTIDWIVCLECGYRVLVHQITIVDILLKTHNSYSIFLTLIVNLRNFIINQADQLAKNKSKLLFLLLQLAPLAGIGQDMSIISLVVILIWPHIASILGSAENRLILIRPVLEVRLFALIILFIIRLIIHELVILLFEFLLQLLIHILLFLLLELFFHVLFAIFILCTLRHIYIISLPFYSLVPYILFHPNLLLICIYQVFYSNVWLVIVLLFYFGRVVLGRVVHARVVCLLQHFLNLYVFYYIISNIFIFIFLILSFLPRILHIIDIIYSFRHQDAHQLKFPVKLSLSRISTHSSTSYCLVLYCD